WSWPWAWTATSSSVASPPRSKGHPIRPSGCWSSPIRWRSAPCGERASRSRWCPPPASFRRPWRAVTTAPSCAAGWGWSSPSGLHYYLSLHPQISMSSPKELNFFIAERNYPRGLDWYRAHFDPRAKVRGESSPNYTAYAQHVGVPERMHSTVPEAKLLYMVRDPIDRIAAHWVHNFAKRREKGDLHATLLHPNTSYLA